MTFELPNFGNPKLQLELIQTRFSPPDENETRRRIMVLTLFSLLTKKLP